MKKTNFLFTLIAVSTMILFSSMLRAQNNDFPELKRDYPNLLERYRDSLDQRNAHYIFAIDISSSMQRYEQTVRESMTTFIDAIPDGDQISIIVVADENNTRFLNEYRCKTINNSSRNQIKEAVSLLTFLKNGNREDGSDGYTMTKKVIDAMSVTGSSEMTFIYLLTDFEYWTHKNKFDKSCEDWSSLILPEKKNKQGLICKYGVELAGSNTVKQEAVFKNELFRVFGNIEYQKAKNANDLADWFNQIQNKIREYKIYALLKRDWEYPTSYKVVLEGYDLRVLLAPSENEFYKKYGVIALESIADFVINDSDEKSPNIGRVEKEKTFFPSYIFINSTDIDVKIFYQSQFLKRDTINHKDIDEVNNLQSQCDSISFLVEQRSVSLPAIRIYNSYIPLWIWGCIILLIIVIIISVIWELSQHPENQSLYVDVQVKRGNNTQYVKGSTSSLPYSVGEDADLQVQGAAWKLVFVGKRYNPIFNLMRRTGCYINLQSGTFADIVSDINDKKITTMSLGDTTRLFKYKETPSQRIEIEDGGTIYIIKISNY